MIKGILFDKDGTLINFEQTWAPTYRLAALTLADGDSKIAAQMLHGSGLTENNRSFVPGSILAAGTNDEIADYWHKFLPQYSENILKHKLNLLLEEGAVTNAIEITNTESFFLKLAKRRLKLGIATNDSETSAIQTMSSFLGTAKIDFIVGCDSGYGGKPNPGMFTAFCQQVGLEPSEVAVVGDNLNDLEMGRRGGAGCLIGVLSGNSDEREFKRHTDYIIDDITFLEQILDILQD